MGFLTAALLLFASAADPGGSLAGVVIGIDGKPIPGATIRIKATALPKPVEVVTQADGIYMAKDLAPGEYEVSAEFPGLLTTSGDARVLSADTTERDYVLKPPPKAPSIPPTSVKPFASTTATIDMGGPAPTPQPNHRDVVSEFRDARHLANDLPPAAITDFDASELRFQTAMENRSLTPAQREYAEREVNRDDVRGNVDAAFKANHIPPDPEAVREVRMAYLGAEESILSSSATPSTMTSQLRDVQENVIGEYLKHRGTPRHHSMFEWITLSLRAPEFATLYLSAAPPTAVLQKVWLDEDTFGAGYTKMPDMNIYKVETLVRHDVTIDIGYHRCSFIVQMQSKKDSEKLVCPHLKAQ